MNSRQAARYLGLSIYYLRNMRHLLHAHEGPDHTMVKRTFGRGGGMTPEYTKEALDDWASKHKVGRKALKNVA